MDVVLRYAVIWMRHFVSGQDWYVRLTESGADGKSFFGKPDGMGGAIERHVWGRHWRIIWRPPNGGGRMVVKEGAAWTKRGARLAASLAFRAY